MPEYPDDAAADRPRLLEKHDCALICFSHIRWTSLLRRSQYLMSKCAGTRRVIFWEEPFYLSDGSEPRLSIKSCHETGVVVVTPHVSDALSGEEQTVLLRCLLDGLFASHPVANVLWYKTPTMRPFSRHLTASCVVYDCMDELAAFEDGPLEFRLIEDELLAAADLVFVGDQGIYDAKRPRHSSVQVFRSAVDDQCSEAARQDTNEPPDPSAVPAPCPGFKGVVDRRSNVRPIADRDAVVSAMSWDELQREMAALVDQVTSEADAAHPIVSPEVWPASRAKPYDVMIVGAGFAGAVMAERLAADAGKRVLVVDRRPHIAGNAFDRLDDAGILIHQYGPHIFHTNSGDIVDYLSHFTEWHPYEHRVLADVNGMLVPMPINRTTLNRLYGCSLSSDEEAAAFLAARAEQVEIVRTSADVVISAVGRELYETFFQGYTRKQWGMDPSELDKSVTSRVPTRTGLDDRYFTDSFQAMPAKGYTAMFERMLDHPNIDLLLGVEYTEAVQAYPHDHLVFTGPIDEYFGFRHGKLPYRSLNFRHEQLQVEQFQPVAVVNYPSEDVPYTRVTEYKHLTGQAAPTTSITYEYPSADGDPYYPIPRPENQELFKRYEALALAQSDVTFVGRLATYRYYNMDQVVGQALATYRRTFRQSSALDRSPTINVAA